MRTGGFAPGSAGIAYALARLAAVAGAAIRRGGTRDAHVRASDGGLDSAIRRSRFAIESAVEKIR